MPALKHNNPKAGVMTPEQIEVEKKTIDEMSQVQMASLWRFAPSGHPYFDKRLPLFEYFQARFKSLGGMTPAVSKSIGLG